MPSPIVIAHRGASGYRPEHTLESYQLAIEQGADYVEPDLVSTRDGVLVARHENEISGTTDIAQHPEFADQRTTKLIDGVEVTGWFTEDLTLTELKTLRARERLPHLRPQNCVYDGRLEVPTLEEIIDLVRREERGLGRSIGLYPETKHPSYFAGIGLPLEEALVDLLARNGYRGPDAPVFLQSFEVSNLRYLASITDLPRIQLYDASRGPYDAPGQTYAAMATLAGLSEVATYAQGIGVHKDLVFPRDASNRMQDATALVQDAHTAGLLVHVWTFRRENHFLPADFRAGDSAAPDHLMAAGDVVGEMRRFLAQGIDGFFTDNPDLGVEAIRSV